MGPAALGSANGVSTPGAGWAVSSGSLTVGTSGVAAFAALRGLRACAASKATSWGVWNTVSNPSAVPKRVVRAVCGLGDSWAVRAVYGLGDSWAAAMKRGEQGRRNPLLRARRLQSGGKQAGLRLMPSDATSIFTQTAAFTGLH